MKRAAGAGLGTWSKFPVLRLPAPPLVRMRAPPLSAPHRRGRGLRGPGESRAREDAVRTAGAPTAGRELGWTSILPPSLPREASAGEVREELVVILQDPKGALKRTGEGWPVL